MAGLSTYTSEHFVESCGAVFFDLTNPRRKTVCLIQHRTKNEWTLAKGRRNCGESRHQAALREAREETGYRAHLHPVTMHTRAPPIDERGYLPDRPRAYAGLTEPFMVTVRRLGGEGDGDDVKIIWWCIAALEEGVGPGSAGEGEGEEQFSAMFFPVEEAVQKLSFQSDRSVLEKAISLV